MNAKKNMPQSITLNVKVVVTKVDPQDRFKSLDQAVEWMKACLNCNINHAKVEIEPLCASDDPAFQAQISALKEMNAINNQLLCTSDGAPKHNGNVEKFQLALHQEDAHLQDGGWSIYPAADGEKGVRYARTIGGKDSGLKRFSMVLSEDDGKWVPWADGVQFSSVDTKVEAANVLIQHWNDLPMAEKLLEQGNVAESAKTTTYVVDDTGGWKSQQRLPMEEAKLALTSTYALTPDEVSMAIAGHNLRTFDGWTAAASALLAGAPSLTGIQEKSSPYVILKAEFDGKPEVVFYYNETNGVFSPDLASDFDSNAWCIESWDGVDVETNIATLTSPDFVTLRHE